MKRINPKPITNQSELAASLGLSRQLISAHAKKPGAPPLSDRAGWIEFLATVGRDGSAPVDIRRAIAQKRLEILEQQRIAAGEAAQGVADPLVAQLPVAASIGPAPVHHGHRRRQPGHLAKHR